MTASAGRSFKILYFAWVREKTGVSEEIVSPPDDVATIAELVAWLKLRGPQFAAAFERPEVIRSAIDQTHANPDAQLAGAREVAFFPPVTGG